MLNALSKLPGVRARIAGDGPYRAEAEELADSLNVKDRADFLGDIRNMQDKIACYKSIGVFVFPSTEVTETFGISQLEAMLMGVPVVASNLRTGAPSDRTTSLDLATRRIPLRPIGFLLEVE